MNEFKDAEIVRTRDLKVLAECDIVVDVGAKFEPENRRFDHHQREFAETMATLNILPGFHTKLSSAGLVYAFFGKAVIKALTGSDINTAENETIYKKVVQWPLLTFNWIINGRFTSRSWRNMTELTTA